MVSTSTGFVRVDEMIVAPVLLTRVGLAVDGTRLHRLVLLVLVRAAGGGLIVLRPSGSEQFPS